MLTAASQQPVANRLIDSLPLKISHQLIECCEPVDLVFGTVLFEPNQPILDAYFPLTGFISLVTTLAGHQPLEIGLIGNEGMLGATLALGVRAAPMRAVVQGPGTALRISVNQLYYELRRSRSLVTTLNNYLYVLMIQMSQSAACTHFHKIGPRLARWLLMIHDRAHANHFHLTHVYLADMLGVRRSGISIAAGDLQRQKLIHYTRGEISILDRKGLEVASCECYKSLINDYNRLFH